MQSHCPRCATRLVVIELRLEGEDVTMGSCSRCDRRYWSSRAGDTDIIGILGHEPLRQPALR